MKKTVKKQFTKKALILFLLMSVILVCILVACNKPNDDSTPTNPTSISITNKPTDNSLTVGSPAITLMYVINPENATISGVRWSVNDSSVALITSQGVLTAVAPGTTVVSVTIDNTEIKDSFRLTVINPEPTVNELLSDLILGGVYNENTPELPRVPLDPDYVKLVTRRESLLIGESYTETFDNGNFLDTKLYPVRSTKQVTANISTDNAFIGSSDRVLWFESTLPNGGIYLTGMQFVASAKYLIEMDYNVIQASNQFYFQFRSYSSGANSDVFVALPSAGIGVGKLSTEITLKDYSDYEIMIFCGTQGGGKIAIDNLKITRQELPQEDNTENFDTLIENLSWAAVGGAQVEKSETTIGAGEERSLSVASTAAGGGVEVALDDIAQSGIRYSVSFALKVISLNGCISVNLGIAEQLNITADYDDKITLIMTPASDTEKFIIVSDNAISILIDSISIKEELPQLEAGTQDANTQDFSNKGGMSYAANNNADLILTRTHLPAGGTDVALKVKSNGAYGGVNFTAENLVVDADYKISFNVKVVDNPNNSIIYIQLGGGGDYKQFDFVSSPTYNPDTGYVSFVMKANVANQLQIFANLSGLVITLDNIRIEEAVLQPQNTESFDGEPSMAYAKNENAVMSITEDSSLLPRGASGKALKIVSGAQYGGVVFETSSLNQERKYLVSFNIKINVSNGSFVYVKLGNGIAKRFDPIYTWDTPAMYDSYNEHITFVLIPNGNNLAIFANAGGMEFVVDNISVKEYSAASQEGLNENFDGESNIGITSNGISEISCIKENLPQGASGNALLVSCKENYTGIVLRMPQKLISGKTYSIKFNFCVIGDYTGPFYVQQYGKAAAFQFDKTSIKNGIISGNITIVEDANTLIQIFAQNATTFVIDNIELEEIAQNTVISSSETPFTSNESEQRHLYAWASTGANTVDVTATQLTVTSTSETYAGAWIRLPENFIAGNNYRIVFRTNANHGLYINIDSGIDTPIYPVNGRVSLVLSGVAGKRVIRIFANNIANANYTINDLYIENIGEFLASENFDTWTMNELSEDNRLAIGNPYSGDNIPEISLLDGKLNVKGKAASDYYGVYIKLDAVLVVGTSYVITFDFDGNYSPYVKAGTEVQCSPENGVITVSVEGAGNNELRIMVPSAPSVDFTIDNIKVKVA